MSLILHNIRNIGYLLEIIYDSLATQVKVFQHDKNYPALFEDGETMWIFYISIYTMDQNLVFSI